MSNKRSPFGRLLRRKRPDGSYLPGFYVRLRTGGSETTRWAGPDRRTAAEFLAILLRSSSRERLLGEKAIPEVTLTEFLPKSIAYFEANHAATTVNGERGCLKRIAAHFGERPMSGITTADVQDFLTGLRAHRHRRDGETVVRNPPASVATRNRYASILSVVFQLAVERGYATANPVKGLRRPKEPKHPVPFISSSDVDRLLAAAADPLFRALLRVLADCGMRRSEAIRLEWRDVYLDRPALVVRQSKSGAPREIPLTAKAKNAFEVLRAAATPVTAGRKDYVWPQFQGKRMGAVEARFRRLRVRAGLPNMRLHDLRHGFCSRLAQEGVPIPTIAALAGHSSIVTTMRYASHLPEGATLDAIRRLDGTASSVRPPDESSFPDGG